MVNFSARPYQTGTDAEAGCGNCLAQQAEEAQSTGRVVLTGALITRWKNQLEHTRREAVGADAPRVLASMEPADVVPFLQATLRWRVTSLGRLVEPDLMPSLRVSVAAGKADHYDDQTKLSRFYDYKGAHEITEGRPQGAGPADTCTRRAGTTAPRTDDDAAVGRR